MKHPFAKTNSHHIIADPYDLATPTKIVCDAVQKEIATLNPNQKFVLIMGEEHATASHILLQATVLNHLNTLDFNDSLLFGVEMDNTMSLESILNNQINVALAPSSKQALMDYCHRDHVHMLFNDVNKISGNGKSYIHPGDRLANQIAWEKHGIILSAENIDVTSTTGLSIRNHAMVYRANQTQNDQKRSILVQSCGSDHANDSGKTPYRDTLTNLYRDAGYKVLPVHVTSTLDRIFNLKNLGVWDENPDAIILDNLSGRRFNHRDHIKEHGSFNETLIEKEHRHIESFKYY